MSYKEGESLRSRLTFADQQVYGRTSKAAIVAIGDVPHDAGPDASLQPETKKALLWVKERVVHGPPRVATLKERSRAFFYTDGACEPGPEGTLPKCSFGGAIFAGSTKLYFGMEIPEDIARPWLARAGKEQMVFECELLPYLVGLALAPGAFKHRDLLVFVDNEAARKTFVKAPSLVVRKDP